MWTSLLYKILCFQVNWTKLSCSLEAKRGMRVPVWLVQLVHITTVGKSEKCSCKWWKVKSETCSYKYWMESLKSIAVNVGKSKSEKCSYKCWTERQKRYVGKSENYAID